MSDAAPQAKEAIKRPSAQPEKKRKPIRLMGLLLILFSAMVGWFMLIGFLGWQSGQQQLQERQFAQLDRQLTLAETDIAQQKFQLALTRLEWVLEREPNSAEAQSLRDRALAGLGATPSPTPVMAVTVTPAPTRLPTATPGAIDSPSDELLRIRRLVATKFWEEALPALLAFQQQFPSFEREETDQLLYDVYLEYGLDLIAGDQVELGMFYLSQAQRLGDLPQSVADYQTWAELYTQGISFYGVNWDASAYYFRDLCLAAPFYRSSCDQLFTVLVALGDQYATTQDWCPAQMVYEEASRHQTTAVLIEKRTEALENCLLATPTPSEPITDTVPISDTAPFIGGSNFVVPSATPNSP